MLNVCTSKSADRTKAATRRACSTCSTEAAERFGRDCGVRRESVVYCYLAVQHAERQFNVEDVRFVGQPHCHSPFVRPPGRRLGQSNGRLSWTLGINKRDYLRNLKIFYGFIRCDETVFLLQLTLISCSGSSRALNRAESTGGAGL